MDSLVGACRNIQLHTEPGQSLFSRPMLTAECPKLDGTWTSSSIDLNKLLGNQDGKFVVGQAFGPSATSIGLIYQASEKTADGKDHPGILVLKADLKRFDGSSNQDEIDLEKLLANMNGTITTRFIYMKTVRLEQDCRAFLENVRALRLDEFELVAELKDTDGSWKERRENLDSYLGNQDGHLVTDGAQFSSTCSQVHLSFWDIKKRPVEKDEARLTELDQSEARVPTTVYLACWAKRSDGSLKWNAILISSIFAAVNGQLVKSSGTIPIFLGIPEENNGNVVQELNRILNDNPGAWVEWADNPEKEGMSSFYIFLGDKESGPSSFFKTTTFEARASIQHYVQDQHVSRFQHVSYDALTMEFHGTVAPYYAGVGASVDLIQAEASIFDITLGVGVETGVGILDETAELEVLGCGVMIGRKVGVSVFGNSFDVNVGRIFGF